MSAESDRAVLDEVRGLIPQSRESAPDLTSFARARMERVITLAAGIGCLALGAQAFVLAVGGDLDAGRQQCLMVATFVPLAVMIVACAVGRGVAATAGSFASIYLIALVLWPWAAGPTPPPTEQPWIWYLVNVATVASLLAFPLPLQIVWTVVTPLLFGVVRIVRGEFDADVWIPVSLDVLFALILGGVLLSLAWVLRTAAARIDRTRARAVDSYARAAAADAAEEERIAVAALMHDSVLAALIAAERAETPRAHQLAAAMAREALTRLADTDGRAYEGSDEPVGRERVADDIARAAWELGVKLSVIRVGLDETRVIPGRVARAIALAATQAVANAVQHAGGAGLTASVTALSAGGISVEVRDAGSGVDLASVPDDRLGIRASIFARVAAVGGVAGMTSGAQGTIVTMSWEGVR